MQNSRGASAGGVQLLFGILRSRAPCAISALRSTTLSLYRASRRLNCPGRA